MGEDNNVTVDVQLIVVSGRLIAQQPLARLAQAGCKLGGCGVKGIAATILNPPVPVLVKPGNEAGRFPLGKPPGGLFIAHVVNVVDDVDPGEGGHRRRGGIQQRDEDQGISSGDACVPHFRHREEPDDHMGQTRRAGHQRRGDKEHVDR